MTETELNLTPSLLSGRARSRANRRPLNVRLFVRRGRVAISAIACFALVSGGCDGGSPSETAVMNDAASAESAALLRSAPFVATFLRSEVGEFRRITVVESAEEEPYRSVLTTGAGLDERVLGRRIRARSEPIPAQELTTLKALLRRRSDLRPAVIPSSWREWEVGMVIAGESSFLLMMHQGGGRCLLVGGPDFVVEIDLSPETAESWSRFWRDSGG